MCGRGKLKVFGQAFYKKLAGCGTESHDLAFLRKQRRKGEKSPSGTFLGGGLRCRVGRWSPVATVQRRPKRELRPVAGRVPPARSDPSPGGAGRRWRPFSADRAGRRDLSSEPKVRSKVHQSSPVPAQRAPSFGVSDGGGTRTAGPTPGLAYGARRLSVAHPPPPPPVNLPGGNRRLFCTGGGEYSILSFQRGILSRLPARSVAGRVPLARSDPFGNPLEGQASQPSAGGFEAPTPTSPAGACPRWAIKSLRKLRDFGRVDPTLANSAPLTCQVNRLSAAHPRPAAGGQRPTEPAGEKATPLGPLF